ncbi:hypothetical protein Tco_0981668 [Tanacetum coccineum]
MANLSEDIQCAGSDTRPPMLDRTDFASWQQRIRLYCRGKENGVNILKSIDEGPFQMGTFWETLAEGTEGVLGPERPRVYSDDLSLKIRKGHMGQCEDAPERMGDKICNSSETYIEADRDSNYDQLVVVQNVQGRQNRGQGNNAWGAGTAGYWGAQNRVENANLGQARHIKCYNCNGNVFQADDYDAFDFDVDEAPTAQTMFMANLSSADPVYDKAGPSYDSDILSEYVKDNAVPVIQSNVSSVPNDAYTMIYNDMYEPHSQSVSKITRNTVVNNLLTAELTTYKEQVALYERRARFELMEREQKIDEQLRIVITDHNIKEENLKKELHSVKLQLASTINHNKSMVEEVTYLKKDFQQKENKYLEEFLDMKALKEKAEDKLYKQDQSL